MHRLFWFAGPLLLLCGGVHAQDALNVCRMGSSYDVTLRGDGVLFDRAQPDPRQVVLSDGTLHVDGVAVALGPEDADRVTLMAREVRALAPKVRAIADRGVDLAAQAVRDEARQATPQLAASGELDARLNAIAARLKARIDASRSTHDWHGPAFDRYAEGLVGEIAPLLGADLAQQAMMMAIDGDLDGASDLRDTAADLPEAIQARVRGRLQALAPDVRTLCPALRRLDALESGIVRPLPGGGHLDLIEPLP